MINCFKFREYRFPPSASINEEMTAEMFIANDEQKLKEERQMIKQLETRLAGGEVSERDSKLLGKLCSLDPT